MILDIPEGYSLVVKTGRCFNGNERDRGSIQHIVKQTPPKWVGDWFSKALCGSEPVNMTSGWSCTAIGDNVSGDNICPKCFNTLQSQ
jgi:hypothetical protein